MSSGGRIITALIMGFALGFIFGVNGNFLGERISLNLVKLKAAQSPAGIYCWTEGSDRYCIGKGISK